MAICFFVPDNEKYSMNCPLDAERLLRGLGVTGKLVGFRYAVFMVEQVRVEPDRLYLITKCLYPDTARHFSVSPTSVERAIRTLIRSCWERSDHSFLEHIAGAPLQYPPTNSEFIDMLASYLRHLQED